MAAHSEVFTQIQAELTERITERIQREISSYRRVPADEIRRRTQRSLEAFGQDLAESEPQHYREYYSQLGYERAQQQVLLADVQQAILVINQEIIAGFKRQLGDDPAVLLAAIEQTHTITESGIVALYEGFERAKDEIIDLQQTALQELSTPIIPIYEGILVLPLVGSIDSQRAGQIMEGLLEGISANSADVVIMDITGVPVIDTGVANYILQAARAARLLGSQVVLVGIGAEIAQTIVQLGIDLSGITTRSNLQTGIEFALGTLGLAIGPEAFQALNQA
ncbi:MAG TPA: STAS domain-containing protein [Herpetosiphonaceae bacterium]